MEIKLWPTTFPLIVLFLAAEESVLSNHQVSAFSSTSSSEKRYVSHLSAVAETKEHPRPLLRNFGRGIKQRINHAKMGTNRFGEVGAYTSEETIPCLDMRGSVNNGDIGKVNISCRNAIRKAFTESSRICCTNNDKTPHGRSSGSGCTIIRLTGSDAASIHGLTRYTDRFFEQVDNDDCNDVVVNTGVFRIDNHVYAGFDENVNGEGKMQFLDTRMLPNKNDDDPLLLPMEVGDLVGTRSLRDAKKGMSTLLDIGTQITSAVLDMDSVSAGKLIDDGTHVQDQAGSESQGLVASDVSNSYQRLIRYLKPQQSSDGTAFQAHVDSTFLTLIPMPELPGLEVWCPSIGNTSIGDENLVNSQSKGGEWVRPALDSSFKQEGTSNHAYVIAMAGEFLQLTSNGQVPTCIHRVIPPKASPVSVSPNGLNGEQRHGKYKPRVSAPMFLRPRRGEEALLNVGEDLKLVGRGSQAQPFASERSCDEDALYFEKGLLEECDSMNLWSAHEIMMRK
mmetsp:Transcript_28364/g.59906  ORF Transcript_28364/g.59906 Transcript_28364/m.59906 type:complete len:506 (-) Transcript_28364:44-1561(-)|eukprot:CAMPEP_0183727820 /NCGR_PEP_ID=MMETSP0737-20130205/26502_1 /TAXON_ID=385413 /ORGANISM="Thalassiosira miniscula, Strain CCMP1093" /LENGTH=505 /DNA_ID=CAMNT_0025959557 /DNA_START=152 /DNA_END=1669 /DNA_ORIENTATION=-